MKIFAYDHVRFWLFSPLKKTLMWQFLMAHHIQNKILNIFLFLVLYVASPEAELAYYSQRQKMEDFCMQLRPFLAVWPLKKL